MLQFLEACAPFALLQVVYFHSEYQEQGKRIQIALELRGKHKGGRREYL
jgi:hypothetical protein